MYGVYYENIMEGITYFRKCKEQACVVPYQNLKLTICLWLNDSTKPVNADVEPLVHSCI